MQAHHFEIGSVDHSGAHFARFAQADHAETYHRKIAELLDRFHPGLQILNLRNRKRHVLDAHPRRALANVDQPVFVAIDERAEQHASHHTEDRCVRANTECEGQHHGNGQAFGAGQ